MFITLMASRAFEVCLATVQVRRMNRLTMEELRALARRDSFEMRRLYAHAVQMLDKRRHRDVALLWLRRLAAAASLQSRQEVPGLGVLAEKPLAPEAAVSVVEGFDKIFKALGPPPEGMPFSRLPAHDGGGGSRR
ncbi:hypothetical protein ABZ479_19735 [Streptomyces sp. NPDC005722]